MTAPATNKPTAEALAKKAAKVKFAFEHATLPQQRVLLRIEAQRERLHARKVALKQAQALRASANADRVDADAPLPIRLLTFAKLHPVAVAAAVGVALAAGPGKLLRVAGIVLPIVMRMRR